MKPRLIVAILVIANLPLCAEAQELSAAKAKADAQKFVKMIIGDKAKSQIYCDALSSVSRSRRLIRKIKRRPMSCISKWTN